MNCLSLSLSLSLWKLRGDLLARLRDRYARVRDALFIIILRLWRGL